MFDIDRPVENPRLKALGQALQNQPTKQTISDFYQELAENAHLLCVVQFSQAPADNGDGTATFQEDSIMRIPQLTATDGRLYFPAFTDWHEVYKFAAAQSKPQAMVFTFDDYAALVADAPESGVVIDPFGLDIVLSAQEVISIKRQKDAFLTPQACRLPAGTKVLVGEAAPTPLLEAMQEQLRRFFAARPYVHQAWLLWMVRDDEGSFLMLIDFDGDKDALYPAIYEAVKPYLDGHYLDFLPYTADNAASFIQDRPPFYQKPAKKGFFRR